MQLGHFGSSSQMIFDGRIPNFALYCRTPIGTCPKRMCHAIHLSLLVSLRFEAAASVVGASIWMSDNGVEDLLLIVRVRVGFSRAGI